MSTIDHYLEVDQSIFTRCIKCDNIFLKSENHTCNKKKIQSLVRWIYDTLKEQGKPLSAESLCYIINKKRDCQVYNKYEIRYMVAKNKKIFKLTDNRFCSLKEWNY